MRPHSDIIEFLTGCGVRNSALDRLGQLEHLYRDLVAANQRLNLTRITVPEDFWTKHIADSLAIGQVLPELLREAWCIADVGCGAGFPGLPLAWANPELQVTGIEPNTGKAEFARNEAAELGLLNVTVLARQAREAGRLPEHAGRYRAVLLRAVGKTDKMIRDCRQLLQRPGGMIVFYLTPAQVVETRKAAGREARKLALSVTESALLELPLKAGKRQLMVLTDIGCEQTSGRR